MRHHAEAYSFPKASIQIISTWGPTHLLPRLLQRIASSLFFTASPSVCAPLNTELALGLSVNRPL